MTGLCNWSKKKECKNEDYKLDNLEKDITLNNWK